MPSKPIRRDKRRVQAGACKPMRTDKRSVEVEVADGRGRVCERVPTGGACELRRDAPSCRAMRTKPIRIVKRRANGGGLPNSDKDIGTSCLGTSKFVISEK